MASARTVLSYLKNHARFLAAYQQSEQSVRFERLIAEACGHVFHLPFFSSDYDNATLKHRVVWNGSAKNNTCAPSGPDAIVYACGFDILVEATLKTGVIQWTQEFSQCVRHYKDFTNGDQSRERDTYLILLATELNQDTYHSVQYKNISNYKFVLMRDLDLANVLDTSILALAIRHIDLRGLLNTIIRCCKESSSLENFLDKSKVSISKWQEDVLKDESHVFFGLKSYQAMRAIGRKSVFISEIHQGLSGKPAVKHYLRLINDTLRPALITQSLQMIRLGYILGHEPEGGEEIFSPVPLVDAKNRIGRLARTLEEMDDQS